MSMLRLDRRQTDSLNNNNSATVDAHKSHNLKNMQAENTVCAAEKLRESNKESRREKNSLKGVVSILAGYDCSV